MNKAAHFEIFFSKIRHKSIKIKKYTDFFFSFRREIMMALVFHQKQHV